MEYSFIRYLEAKRSVDDCALNKDVWRALKKAISQRDTEAPLRVLELGAGTGTMLDRMLEWGLFDKAHYGFLDQDEHNVAAAKKRFAKKSPHLTMDFFQAEVFAFLNDYAGQAWDLIVAHAFLDLLDVRQLLSRLVEHLGEAGMCYFTINYDGETIFEPVIDPDLDAHIVRLYNRSMHEREIEGVRSGDSQAGRHLFSQIQSAGLQIVQAGSSDWVVFPSRGKYPHDQADFLLHILHFIEDSLTGHPQLDANVFANWLQLRRQQIGRGELVYIAHQLDFLAALNAT